MLCRCPDVGSAILVPALRHTVTLGAGDKLAAELLYVMEMLSWALSWILCGSGREGQECCQVRAGIQPAHHY